ncbi:MAG: hypothetical protein H6719_14500 [Sandaracinaceae bacterium]|nr:hypothetical protein [Sandaracinaceae bacterium]
MPALSEYANVYDTALVALEDKEFQVWFDPGPSLYCAEKDGWDFAAENPVSLLGLVAIWEQVGPSAYEEYWWRAGPPSGEPRYRTLPSAPPTGYTPIRERGGQRLFQASRWPSVTRDEARDREVRRWQVQTDRPVAEPAGWEHDLPDGATVRVTSASSLEVIIDLPTDPHFDPDAEMRRICDILRGVDDRWAITTLQGRPRSDWSVLLGPPASTDREAAHQGGRPMTDEHSGPESPWIRSYFQRFAVRPGMSFEDRRARSVYLWTLGYRWAREDLGYPEYGHGEESLLADFCAWLAKRTGLVGVDWIHHIEHIDSSPDNAVTLFRLFDEFLGERHR